MKLTAYCFALMALGSAMPTFAQTNTASTVLTPRRTFSAAEIAKMLSKVTCGSTPPTPQEKAYCDAISAKINEIERDASEALQNKNFVVAEADYRDRVRTGTNDRTDYYGLGEALAGEGRTADAIAAYKVGVYWPRNTPETYLYMQKHGDTRSNLNGCNGDTDAIAWIKCALLLSQTGQQVEAYNIYSEASRYLPKLNGLETKLIATDGSLPSPEMFQSAGHIALGLLGWGRSTNEENMAEFEKALQLQPDSAAANYYYGLGWKRLDTKSLLKAADATKAKAALKAAALSDEEAVKDAAAEELKGLK